MKVFRIILLVFNILAALGLVATTLAGLIAPSDNILPSVAVYGFLPMLALNILLVIVWLCMGRWEALISVGIILLRISYVGYFFQIGGTSEVPPAEEHPAMVTLLSYNLHNFGGKDFEGVSSAEHADAFLQLLDENGQPDILCLQEYAGAPKRDITDSLKVRGRESLRHGGLLEAAHHLREEYRPAKDTCGATEGETHVPCLLRPHGQLPVHAGQP